MNKFLNFSFWLDAKPLPFMPVFYWLALGVCLGAIILGVISSVLRSKKFKDNKLAKKVWQKIGNWSYSFGGAGLVLIFLKQQRVPYLGMRVWFVLWLLAFFVWLLFILKYIFIKVPKIKKEQKKKKEFEKYLP
ncbi:hypothetical protein KJ840_05475 [Patescibacteria group bacterium]|nr:hypothetical protein [Patescibacteria group bacterium]